MVKKILLRNQLDMRMLIKGNINFKIEDFLKYEQVSIDS